MRLLAIESREGLAERRGLFRLSYKAHPCHAVPMPREPKWKRRAIAIEFWLLTALVAGSFVAGIIGAIRAVSGN
jgi:hypothetical protein